MLSPMVSFDYGAMPLQSYPEMHVYGEPMRAGTYVSPYSPEDEEEYPVFDYSSKRGRQLNIRPPSPEEHEMIVDEQRDRIAFFAPTSEMENVRLDGQAKQGCLLTVMGAAPHLASYQWYRHEQNGSKLEIRGALGPSYRCVAEDVGHVLSVDVTQGGKTLTATSEVVDHPPTALQRLEITGGPYHTCPLTVRSLDEPAGSGHPRVQWFRADPATHYYERIQHAISTTYTPTADDLCAMLRVEYTPKLPDGSDAPTSMAVVPPEYLEIDPAISQPVEQAVTDKTISFDVMLLDNKLAGGTEPRQIILQESHMFIKKGGKTKAKTRYYSDVAVTLSPYKEDEFELTWDKTYFHFKCADIRQRDCIALAIRSFVNLRVLKKGKYGIHRVVSLTDLREEEKATKRF